MIFAAGGLAAYINQGLTFSLTNYVTLYVWRLDTSQMPLLPEGVTALSLYPLALFISAILMFFVVGPMHKHLGKPRSAAASALGTIVFTLVPYMLLYAGFWPELNTALSGILLLSLLIIGNTLGIVVLISASSMIAEIVEAYLERTGKRAEGAFYSGNWLVQKCATGFGIFLTGQILSMISFSRDAVPGDVPAPVIDNLILIYALSTTVLMGIAAFWLGRFPITREDHEARVEALTNKRLENPPETTTP